MKRMHSNATLAVKKCILHKNILSTCTCECYLLVVFETAGLTPLNYHSLPSPPSPLFLPPTPTSTVILLLVTTFLTSPPSLLSPPFPPSSTSAPSSLFLLPHYSIPFTPMLLLFPLFLLYPLFLLSTVFLLLPYSFYPIPPSRAIRPVLSIPPTPR